MKISLPNKVSLFISLLFAFLIFSFSFLVIQVRAQVPGLRSPPCPEPGDPEFQSLRPYQTSLCGQIAKKATFCSNTLEFVESFDMVGQNDCDLSYCGECTFTCSPNYPVDPHTLYIELDNSFLPILGNTELVKNSQQAVDSLDDATKMSEYVSWYLSGVTDTPEYGENTDEKLVNYSGPVNKLLPSLIQDSERIGSIKEALATGNTYTDEGDDPRGESETITGERHPEIVVCASRSILGIAGRMVAHECYEGNGSKAKEKVYRLTDWKNHMPPLPWDPEYENNPKAYTEARCDWEGGTPVTIPIINQFVCIDNPLKSNEWADLFHYVPLSPVADKKGANYILGDGPDFVATTGTTIEKAMFKDIKNAPLYFAHTQEDKELSELLNSTYVPQGIEGEYLPETTELNESTNPNECRLVNIRANPGDDLFPGEPNEMQIQGVQYLITGATCHETVVEKEICTLIVPGKGCVEKEFVEVPSIKCPAQVTIKIQTGTKSPWAKEIWKTTTADSTSTFRKIFPKVEEGAPVSCIASMPTETTVEYDPSKSEKPNGGDQEFFVKAPGGGKVDPSDAKLHFPFIGSVYEYFLKGIQTALRPQGYGEPITNGEYCEPKEIKECDVSVPDSAVPSKYLGGFKTNFIDMANRWVTGCEGPENNLAEECYNFVASVAQKEGVNPAFALTIWLNESGASNYCAGGETTQDFGINLPELYQDIAGQLLRFIGMAKTKLCDGVGGFSEPMHGWLSRFKSVTGTCDPTYECGTAYAYGGSCTEPGGQALEMGEGIAGVWQFVTGGCFNNGKFSIQWPTDMSCP